MGSYTHSIDVNRPVRTCYNQWTQFEDFPQFMEGVLSVRQQDDAHLMWDVDIAGVSRQFNATITEQMPDERIAWTTTDGPYQAGVVTFHRLSNDSCRVTLQMDFEPQGMAEKAGDMLGIVRGRIEGDLRRFKEFIEDEGYETGAWRGRVQGGQVQGDRENIDLRGERQPQMPGDTGLGGIGAGADSGY